MLRALMPALTGAAPSLRLQVLDAGLSGAGVPYAYGFAIILLTILVKLATFPLSKQQVRQTKMGSYAIIPLGVFSALHFGLAFAE